MTSVFLDTGYVLALELANDTNHEAALRHWRQAARKAPRLVTTSYVFDEIVTFFNSRNLHAKAIEVGGNLLRSPSVELIRVGEELFFAGWQFFQKHRDKRYSLTDCISFVVMQRHDLTVAYAFDKHFAQAGFTKLP